MGRGGIFECPGRRAVQHLVASAIYVLLGCNVRAIAGA